MMADNFNLVFLLTFKGLQTLSKYADTKIDVWLVSVAPLNNIWLRLNNAIVYIFHSFKNFLKNILSNTT